METNLPDSIVLKTIVDEYIPTPLLVIPATFISYFWFEAKPLRTACLSVTMACICPPNPSVRLYLTLYDATTPCLAPSIMSDHETLSALADNEATVMSFGASLGTKIRYIDR